MEAIITYLEQINGEWQPRNKIIETNDIDKLWNALFEAEKIFDTVILLDVMDVKDDENLEK